MRRFLALVAVAVLLTGCSGGSNDTSSGSETSTAKETAAAGNDGKGVGSITHIDLGPIDATVAAKGQEVFDSKCAVCHKFEERYVGPALAGITTRRKPEWIMNMILNPELMIAEDPDAKALFTEFLTPMANQNISEEDAKAILTYFRSRDEGAGNP
jgi:mono/diheme cytochrome c family protein